MSVKRRDVSEEDGTSASGIPVFGPVPPDPQHTINRLVSENTTLRTRLVEVEADAAVMVGLLKEARYLIIEHHSYWVLREEHVACPVCSSPKGDSLLNRIEKALQPCPTCGGEGGIDSGGVTPWGSGISIPCPSCNSEGDKK